MGAGGAPDLSWQWGLHGQLQSQERQAFISLRSVCVGEACETDRVGTDSWPTMWMGCLPAGHVSTADPRSREVIRNACKAVGSISSTAFDVRFNPDIFSPGKWWSRVGRIWSHHGASMLVGPSPT